MFWSNVTYSKPEMGYPSASPVRGADPPHRLPALRAVFMQRAGAPIRVRPQRASLNPALRQGTRVAGLPLAVNGRVQRRCIQRLRGHAAAAAHIAAERGRGALLAATSMAHKAAMRSEQPAGLAAPSQPQGSRACSRPGH